MVTGYIKRTIPFLLVAAALGVLGHARLRLLLVEHAADVYTTALLYLALLVVGLVVAGIAGIVLRMSPRRRMGAKVAWCTLCLALFGAELFLRYVDARYVPRTERIEGGLWLPLYPPSVYLDPQHPANHEDTWLTDAPNQHYEQRHPEFSYTVTTNDLGLRDRNHPVTKPPGETRVLCLGDSFTQGVGSPEPQTWPRLLERVLRQWDPKVSVMNGGREGTDPFFAYRLLERHLLPYRPDVVVVTINQGDQYDYVLWGGTERFQPHGMLRGRPPPWWQPAYAASVVFRHVVHDLLGYDTEFVHRDERQALDQEMREQTFELFQRFQALGEAQGYELLVVFLPMMDELEAGALEQQPVLTRLDEETDVATLDLREAFNRAGVRDSPEGPLYYPLDRHFTPRGNEVTAVTVARALRDRSWVE